MVTKEPIKVWTPDDCPMKIWECFTNHDDIDWIAVVPKRYLNKYLGFLESSAFGCCDVGQYEGPEGTKIYVGYHS